jgi:alkylation response protein AidB-like acyl-CoA dehydrogenase
MDFNDTLEEAAFRAEARAFLRANAEPKAGSRPVLRQSGIDAAAVARCKAWQVKKADAGFAALTWPKRFGGREAPSILQVIYNQEEDDFVVPRGLYEIGLGMCIPTLMTYADDAVLDRHVRPALRGEEVWCQLFSEPAGGSDLAALRTRAERDGDDWVINGQKIWTSGAHLSDFGIVVVRTDPNVPKHEGLTFFFLDMKSPGIDIRPLREITGDSLFNEVFLDNVFVPDELVVGAVNDGWRLARTTLANERIAMANGTALGNPMEELLELLSKIDLDVAEEDRLGRLIILAQTGALLDRRIAQLAVGGQDPGAQSSVRKLIGVRYRQALAEFTMDVSEGGGLVDRRADNDRAVFDFLNTRCLTIAGGTEQILLTVAAERLLGLPR